jgi:hypothetical protein
MEVQDVYCVGNDRDVLLAKSEKKVLRRLCGVLVDVQSILRHRTKCLSEMANVDQYTVAETIAAPSHALASAMAAHHVHTSLSHYPDHWDTEALGDHGFDEEQLESDLRRRVTSAIARAWNGD